MQLWSSYRDLSSPTDKAVQAKTDSSGNTYLLAELTKSSGVDVALCKVNQAGGISWTRPITNSGADKARALTLMPSGGATFGLSLFNATSKVASDFIRRYDSSGNMLWNFGPIPDGFQTSAVGSASDGTVYAAGIVQGHIRLIKLTNSGQLVWSYDLPVQSGGGTDGISALAIDSSSSVYIVGSFWNGSADVPAITKIGSLGNLEWAETISVPDQESGSATALLITRQNVPAVAGTSKINGVWRGWLAVYDAAGTQQWARTSAEYGFLGERYDAIGLDPWDRLVVAGAAQTSPINQDFFVARISTTNVPIWSKTFDGPASAADAAGWLAIDAWGNSYIGGTVQTASSGKDYALLKLGPTGANLWPNSGDVFYNGAALFDGGGNLDNTPAGLGVDTRGAAYFAGTSKGPSGGFDIHVAKYGLTDAATFVDQQVPTTMIAGMGYDVTVRFLNAGNSVWTKPDGYKMGSLNPNDNKNWGFNRVELPFTDSIAGGQIATFKFKVTAPINAGTYNFQWRMRNSLGWFGDSSTSVPVSITVLPDATRYLSQVVPTSVKKGSTFTVTATLRNVGDNAWSKSTHRLEAVPGYYSWGITGITLADGETVAKGAQKVFNITCVAPSTAGSFKMRWQMRGPNGTFTEQTAAKTITVTN